MRCVGMAKPRAQTSHRKYPCNAVLFHRDARNGGLFAFCTKKGAFSEFRYRNLTPRCRGAILRRCISARCRHIGTANRHCIGAADMLALIDRSGQSRGRDRDTDQQLCRIRSRCGRNAPPRASTRLPTSFASECTAVRSVSLLRYRTHNRASTGLPLQAFVAVQRMSRRRWERASGKPTFTQPTLSVLRMTQHPAHTGETAATRRRTRAQSGEAEHFSPLAFSLRAPSLAAGDEDTVLRKVGLPQATRSVIRVAHGVQV